MKNSKSNGTLQEALNLQLVIPPLRRFNRSCASGHAVLMRTTLLIACILVAAPAVAQDVPALWRDPDGGCAYFRIGNTLSLRYQRDGSPDCPDVRREISSPPAPSADQTGAVTRDDVHDVIRAIEGPNRRLMT
jgi:hypothetical protein